MAKHKCQKSTWLAQYHPKERALPWRRGKKGSAWFLGFLGIFWASLSQAEEKLKPDLKEVAQVFSFDFDQENTLACKGQCNLRLKHKISSLELTQGGARNLLEALKLFPFTFLHKDILGMHGTYGANRVLYLLNGQRINNPYDGLAFLYMPIDVIDYIEIHYGPGGTEYGESSLAGTVMVNTKKHQPLQIFGNLDNHKSFETGFLINGHIGSLKTGIFGALWNDPAKQNQGLWSNAYGEFELIRNKRIYLNADVGFKIEKANKSNWWLYNQVHVIKKSKNKKTIDLFIKNNLFHTNKSLILDLETGIESELSPMLGHNINVGSGAKFSGLFKDNKMAVPKNHKRCTVIRGLNNFFNLCNGQLYLYGQDEWQIRPPFFAIFGARIVLPLEKDLSLSPEILPTIGMVVIPHKKWRYKISFQSSFRTPTFLELTSPSQNDIFLDYERIRTLEGSIWLNDKFGDLFMYNNFSIHFSKIDEFIDKNKNHKLSNKNELDIFGLRLSSDFKMDNSQIGIGVAYSWVYRKEFDEAGYARCRAGIYNPFSQLPLCDHYLPVPPFSAYIKASFDLLVYGDLNIFSSFYKFLDKSDNNIISILDISYSSKLFWRYCNIWASLKNLLGGITMKDDLKSKGTTFFVGLNISF